MSKKPRTCNASVAALIHKHGLAAVKSAVDMAVELSVDPETKKAAKRTAKVSTVKTQSEAFASSYPTTIADLS